MYRIYLNFNLVKKQQLSNWAKRPLTEAQMKYAACDALVLLRLYDAMSFEIEDLYDRPTDTHAIKADIELPDYVHITTNVKQGNRDEKARARTVGLLPAGTINAGDKTNNDIRENSTERTQETEIIECIRDRTNTLFDSNGDNVDIESACGKRGRSVSIGEFRRVAASFMLKSQSQRESIWIPHHKKITKM